MIHFFRETPDLEISYHIAHATSEDAARAVIRLLAPDSSSIRLGDGSDQVTYKASLRQFCINSADEGHAHLLNHIGFWED